MRKAAMIFLLFTFISSGLLMFGQDDPYLWLEDVQGEKALAWVKEQNNESIPVLEKVAGFGETLQKASDIFNSKERIAYPSLRGKYLYNFWQDEKNVRGVLRRTTLKEYRKANPNWEIVLDIDQLAEKEKENWVYQGTSELYPTYDRCLVFLSRGGGDAQVIREFDLNKKQFVTNGFVLPEAKSSVSWRDKDSIYAGTNFGEGSLTTSGYPRIIKIWKRGTPLTEAKTIYEADPKSVSAYAGRMHDGKEYIDFVAEGNTFYTGTTFILKGDKLTKIPIPDDARINGYFKKQLIIELKSDWQIQGNTYKQGSVIIGNLADILNNNFKFQILFAPGDRDSVTDLSTTKNTILLTVQDNVIDKVYRFRQNANGLWQSKPEDLPGNGSLSVSNTSEKNDDYFFNYVSFLSPASLYLKFYKSNKIEKLKQLPDFFDPSPYGVEQLVAVSADGTKIPYFIIKSKSMIADGNNPTILYGYGGFEISMKPSYSALLGNAWLSQGGVYVLANIRGGGEFGPKWHQAGLKKNRRKVYEDFIAVAEDLIQRKITSADKLGIMGGSNGGLLVGAVFVMRPDLFKAVVCQVPLLDMKRYNKMLAGASWMAEFGDPDDPDMWEYIKTYSPYHNIIKDKKYPKVFFLTSTRDDRVHPGHSRKMVARMKEMGHPVYYYENTEGGHSAAANLKQRAYRSSLEYAYFYKMLMNR